VSNNKESTLLILVKENKMFEKGKKVDTVIRGALFVLVSW